MNIVKPTVEHLSELITWVGTEEQLIEWAGPNMHYPSDVDTLAGDLYSDGWPAYALVSEGRELLAFGQYYLRLGRCHLCRLIVSPNHRGSGIVRRLIEMISIEGTQELDVRSCSLFVYRDNASAIKAYRKMGFANKEYPATDTIDDCFYMVRN